MKPPPCRERGGQFPRLQGRRNRFIAASCIKRGAFWGKQEDRLPERESCFQAPPLCDLLFARHATTVARKTTGWWYTTTCINGRTFSVLKNNCLWGKYLETCTGNGNCSPRVFGGFRVITYDLYAWVAMSEKLNEMACEIDIHSNNSEKILEIQINLLGVK